VPVTETAVLTELLRKAAAKRTDPVIVINADAQSPHQSVITVMEAARNAGLVAPELRDTTPQRPMSLGLKTAVRSWAHQRVRRAWQRRGVLALLLYPLHLVHRAGAACARSPHAWDATCRSGCRCR
jgi:hypothetical protein